MAGQLSSGRQALSVCPRKRQLARSLLASPMGRGTEAGGPGAFKGLKSLHTVLSCWKLCLHEGTAKIGGRASEHHFQILLMWVFCGPLLRFSASGASTSWGLVSLKTCLPSIFVVINCPCADWSMNCRFQLCGPYCVSYCWCSVLPFSVDAGPKITLRLAGLVGSRCAGSTVHLAA